MHENLDIIPIHVFADTANKAEMLNGQLRAHGLAVKPLWRNAISEDGEFNPELVFYFADTHSPSLDEVLRYSAQRNAPLLVVARTYDAEAAEQALVAGASDWLLAGHDALLAAAVQRARQARHNIERIRQLEEARARDRELIEGSFSSSQDALATLSEGIFVEANAACAERLGYSDGKSLSGQPVMDLLAPASRAEFKQGLKQLLKQGTMQDLAEIRVVHPNGKEKEIRIKLEPLKKGGEPRVRMRILGNNTDQKLLERIRALEEQNENLVERANSLTQHDPGSHLLRPAHFAPLAAQALGHARSGAISALALIRPANARETHQKFGVIGTAELGNQLGKALSAGLEEGDLATLGTDLNLIVVLTRNTTNSLEEWISTTLKTLSERVFEGGEHSGHLAFCAGYTIVNRIRQLDPLVKQAEEATAGPGTVNRYQDNVNALEVDDDSWKTVIREALEDHRYTVLLEPIEDLTSGARIYVAQPCLSDRDGLCIEAANFQPPAARLGLLQVLEHRFVGHALRALLAKRQEGTETGIIVPLHRDSIMDEKLFDFLHNLIKRAMEAPPADSLALELDANDITARIRDAEVFVKRAKALDCTVGLRNYTPTSEANKLVRHLRIKRVRLGKSFIPQLEENSEASHDFKSLVEQFTQHGIAVIATGVNDSNAMAHLYNLGISMMQGPTIGEAELFRSAKSDA